ncbi:MAG TPA: zinc-dependent alcohol dehydrogenase family protein [Vicinamibacteria bacterium]|nr:zinc-dependent alcohol dehydrogenase family protein [Vicinamibacteria bacterium]
MRAMVLERQRQPLLPRERPVPPVSEGQLLIQVDACAVCRTDLHVVDGELNDPKLPLVLGHQVAGTVVESRSASFAAGERVGVPWLGWTCGRCRYCTSGRENLCDRARFTGYTLDGGYAERAVADARFCFRLPDGYASEEAAPLLCAGLIGYRAYRMCGDARRLGFYGFGSAAQILAQVARADGREVCAFTRPGDGAAQDLARSHGAVWAGGSGERVPLDAAIVFAPAGPLVVEALRNLEKGGTVVCAGIHMSDVPSFPYELLWGERVVRSVANLTRGDGATFFERLASLHIGTRRTAYPLERANQALSDLRSGALLGTAVLRI